MNRPCPHPFEKIKAFGKTDDPRQVEGTGLQSIGKVLRMNQASRVDAGAAKTQSFYVFDLPVKNQAADPGF